MALRNSWEEAGSLYNPAKHLSATEFNLAVIMFVVGLDWADDATLTFDDIINGIRDNYTGDDLKQTLGVPTAANSYLEPERSLLLQLPRRAYRQRQIAEAA